MNAQPILKFTRILCIGKEVKTGISYAMAAYDQQVQVIYSW
jgi:hypothetical protein